MIDMINSALLCYMINSALPCYMITSGMDKEIPTKVAGTLSSSAALKCFALIVTALLIGQSCFMLWLWTTGRIDLSQVHIVEERTVSKLNNIEY